MAGNSSREIPSLWPLRAIALAIALLLWLFSSLLPRLANLSEKEVAVSLSYAVTPDNMIADTSRRPSEVTVRIRGTEDVIGPVGNESIRVTVPLPERIEPGIATEVFLSPENAVAPEGVEIISFSPASVMVLIDELDQVAVDIVPQFSGEPGAGLTLADVRATARPSRVLLSGPRSTVDGLTSVSTQPIDLSGRAIDFSEQVGFDLDDYANVSARPDLVTIDVKLEADSTTAPGNGPTTSNGESGG